MQQHTEQSKATNVPSEEHLRALFMLCKDGQFANAIKEAKRLIAKFPEAFELWNMVGVANVKLNQFDLAADAFQKSVQINPKYITGYNNLAGAFYGKANVLMTRGKLREAIACYNEALSAKPDFFGAHYNKAIALKDQGKLDEAIASYDNALSVNPRNAEAHNNKGSALQRQGKFAEALQSYGRALTLNPNYAEAHFNKAVALCAQGEPNEAIRSYDNALAIAPGDAEAHANRAAVLNDLGRLDEAIDSYDKALVINPKYARALNNRAVALKRRGRLDEAISSCDEALVINPEYPEAHVNKANALQEKGGITAAIHHYQEALTFNPDHPEAMAQLLHLKNHVFDWADHDSLTRACMNLGMGKNIVSPFPMLSIEDDTRKQLTRSRAYASEKFQHEHRPLRPAPQNKPTRLKLGYFGADFHDHATLFLMSGLLRDYDRRRFEVFVYSYGRRKSGEMRERIRGDVDHFFDVADHSERSIAELAHTHNLDIAIDLKGYTQHSRSGIFQYRIAPVQINYLGYPGSMGVDFIDYIIADPTVIPADQRPYYSERVIYLPDCYQPNDNTRPITTEKKSRVDFGLQEGSFVFCCFNNNYKIGPREFDIWMRILRKIDNSVLWLLRSNAWSEANLRHEVRKRGVDPSRVIFAEMLPQAEHLARHRHADLFMDTFNYNAHTTASDALWAGLPVITKQGQQFSARVAASLLNAVGLPELVATGYEEYEDLILDLARNKGRLLAIKEKLHKNTLTWPLFNTARYIDKFENGLETAFDRFFCGYAPKDIWVDEN